MSPILTQFLARTRHRGLSEITPYLYQYQQRDAIRHIFRVAASLDSMVLGEPQILGQVKAAYAVAHATGTLGGALEEVLSRSFAVAKRIRTETGIASSAIASRSRTSTGAVLWLKPTKQKFMAFSCVRNWLCVK